MITFIEPKILSTRHLLNEYDTIKRIPLTIQRDLKRGKSSLDAKNIPKIYKLGRGNEKFFYNKAIFLRNRYKALVHELYMRRIMVKALNPDVFLDCPDHCRANYVPSKDELQLCYKFYKLNNKYVDKRV